MIVRIRPARMDERHLVRVLREMGKEFARPGAALPLLRPRERRAHQRPDFTGKKTGLRIKSIEWLAIPLLELGLVIPSVHVARPAVRENPDHRLCARDEVRRFWRERIERVRRTGGKARPLEERAERKH